MPIPAGRHRNRLLRDGVERSAPRRVESRLMRAPDILLAHHSVIGKREGFLTPDPADGIYQSGQRIGGKTGLT